MFKKSIFSLALFALVSCYETPEETRVLDVSESDSVLVLDVSNAACDKCQRIMEGGLKGQLGVKQSILNLHTKQVSIVYNSDKVSQDVLKEKRYVMNPLPSFYPRSF